VTDPRLNRFLHLERARPEAPGAEVPEPAGVSERIAGVEQPRPDAPAPAAPPTGASLPRFGAEREPSLELADTDARRPFTRCARCGMDNNAFQPVCQGCGASLATAEQRAFDARFWAERDAQDAAETRAEAALQEGRERAGAADAAARQAMGEAIAREVGEAERRRLDGALGGPGAWGPGGYDPSPLGLRILRRLPDARWQLGAVALAAVVVGGLVLHGLATGGGKSPTFIAGVVLFLLLVLPGGGRRRWWRDG
jgi:hypothetical protein